MLCHEATLILTGATESREADCREAEGHVASCPSCWDALVRLHREAAGGPPPGAQRVATFLECANVAERLYRLVRLDRPGIAATDPAAASHLSWCEPCRERFADMVDVDLASARGLFESAVERPPLGARLRAVAGRVRIVLRDGLVTVAELPESSFASLGTAPVPVRGRGTRSSASCVVTIPLPNGDSASLGVDGEASGAVRLEVVVPGGDRDAATVQLRRVLPDGPELVAAQTMRGGGIAALRDVPRGTYLLDIVRHEGAGGLRVELAVEVGE